MIFSHRTVRDGEGKLHLQLFRRLSRDAKLDYLGSVPVPEELPSAVLEDVHKFSAAGFQLVVGEGEDTPTRIFVVSGTSMMLVAVGPDELRAFVQQAQHALERVTGMPVINGDLAIMSKQLGAVMAQLKALQVDTNNHRETVRHEVRQVVDEFKTRDQQVEQLLQQLNALTQTGPVVVSPSPPAEIEPFVVTATPQEMWEKGYGDKFRERQQRYWLVVRALAKAISEAMKRPDGCDHRIPPELLCARLTSKCPVLSKGVFDTYYAEAQKQGRVSLGSDHLVELRRGEPFQARETFIVDMIMVEEVFRIEEELWLKLTKWFKGLQADLNPPYKLKKVTDYLADYALDLNTLLHEQHAAACARAKVQKKEALSKGLPWGTKTVTGLQLLIDRLNKVMLDGEAARVKFSMDCDPLTFQANDRVADIGGHAFQMLQDLRADRRLRLLNQITRVPGDADVVLEETPLLTHEQWHTLGMGALQAIGLSRSVALDLMFPGCRQGNPNESAVGRGLDYVIPMLEKLRDHGVVDWFMDMVTPVEEESDGSETSEGKEIIYVETSGPVEGGHRAGNDL